LKLCIGYNVIGNVHWFQYNSCYTDLRICYEFDYTSINVHYQCTVSRTTPLLGIKHILCPDLNISPLRGLCPTHPSKIMTDGSDDLSTNTNYKRDCCFVHFDGFFSLNLSN
jgi:hypothetical protein